jgi:putative spermidine/putrescine transport system permease protein
VGALVANGGRRIIGSLRGEGRVTASLLLPAVALLALAFAWPLADILWRSVSDPSFGLGNYTWFFTTDVNIEILLRTLWISAAVTAICIVLGYPYAYLMLISKNWVKALLLLAVLIPLFTSTITRTFAWIIILQGNGVLNHVLGWFGIGRVDLLGTSTAVIMGMAQVMMPFAVLPLYAAMSRIDLRLLTAAQSLGAGPAVSFWRVFVPLSLPGVLAAGVVVIVVCFGFYITPAMLGGGGNSLLPVVVEVQVGRLLEWGRGGAMAVILLLLTLAMLALLAFSLRRSSVFRAPVAR